MKTGIMQPYLFPYIGYFQLISTVDKFVFYDDVAFIKQGWINRNRLAIKGNPFLFTIALKSQSSFKNINQTEINNKEYKQWTKKFFKTLEFTYKKAPCFDSTFSLLKSVLTSEHQFISDLSKSSIYAVVNYLGLKTEIVNTSEIYKNSNLKSEERVIDICLNENASAYVNPNGGVGLYSKSRFKEKNIQLEFLVPEIIEYPQFNDKFIPNLSIIDVLMFNEQKEVLSLLKKYKTI